MKAIRKLFGIPDPQSASATPAAAPSPEAEAAERSARAQADAAHIEAQDARRRRLKEEATLNPFQEVRSAATFLANRGTRYSGLKQRLGG
jgi:hypothetical protein